MALKLKKKTLCGVERCSLKHSGSESANFQQCSVLVDTSQAVQFCGSALS